MKLFEFSCKYPGMLSKRGMSFPMQQEIIMGFEVFAYLKADIYGQSDFVLDLLICTSNLDIFY